MLTKKEYKITHINWSIDQPYEGKELDEHYNEYVKLYNQKQALIAQGKTPIQDPFKGYIER